MSNIIVIGAAGQLGQCLQAVAREKKLSGVIFLTREIADILNKDSLQAAFREHQPAYCINCAAYTAVDRAEDEPELSRKINKDGVVELSKLCKEFDATLIHISTDFVFSGNNHSPLLETDSADPVNMYGATKLEGEREIALYLDKFFIIRTSWLYSEYAGNFVKTMLRLGKEKEELRVIWDQVGTPTYAIDLASAILRIIEIESEDYGIYHYSNEGVTSWYDFAKAIFDISNIPVKVIPVRTFEYQTRAKRPLYSVLDKTKIKKSLTLEIPHWRESLEICLNRL